VELSRQMSSCKDLVVDPSQLGSLKGLIGTKDTRGFILVRPLTVKVRPTSSWVGIAEVSMTRERDTLCPALDQLFLALSRQRVVPLYTRVDALRPTESQPAHRQCPAR
jgi:hypothetical protein